jgi:tRNA(Ile)-lysidine synthase
MLDSDVVERLRRRDVERLVVAYSGGLDSHVLLHLVKRIDPGPEIHALHINHGLSMAADDWQRHCEEICREMGVPFTSRKVHVVTGGSLEENARRARFEAFEEFLDPGDLLLLAHHLDDQIETLFFYLFRGNTPVGVRGMPRERSLENGVLFRPMLDIPRARLSDYAREAGLHWIEDASNADLGLDRNYLRHEVIPRVRARWPNVDRVLLQAIYRDAEALQLIDYIGNIDLDQALDMDGGVRLAALEDLPGPRFKNLIRCWINRLGVPRPGDALLEEARASIAAAPGDAAPLLAWQSVELRRFKNRLYVLDKLAEFDGSVCIRLKPEEVLNVAGGVFYNEIIEGKGIRPDMIENLTIKFRRGGERIRLSRSKTLKNLFQERGVPSWLRDRVPLVFAQDDLVAIAGLPEWNVPPVTASTYAVSGEERGYIFWFGRVGPLKSD